MDFLEIFECPSCHVSLEGAVTEGTREKPIKGNLMCPKCGFFYPIENEALIFIPKSERIKEFWQKDASKLPEILKYERKYKAALSQPERKIYEQALALLETEVRSYFRGGFAVELASSKGTFIRQFILRPFNGTYILSDFSLTYLHWLREVLEEDKDEKNELRYVVADARMLPFSKGALTLVVSSLGFLNVPRAGKIFERIYEVLKDDGVFVGKFLWINNPEAEKALAADEFKLDTFVSKEKTINALKDAGFRVRVKQTAEVSATGNEYDTFPKAGDKYSFGIVTGLKASE